MAADGEALVFACEGQADELLDGAVEGGVGGGVAGGAGEVGLVGVVAFFCVW